ncbi:MAG: ribonuclease P protein component [Candidatus Paceibacterota bacterium]
MFPRSSRLRRSHDILTVFRRGSRRSHGPLTCYLFPTVKDGHRVAVIVDKKVSKLAVERNVVKRRIRAALKECSLPQGNLVVKAHTGSVDLSYQSIRDSLSSCLRVLSR